MELAKKLHELADKIEWRLPPARRSEASTSQFLVMPFFEMLGYSVHNPNHVEPEFTADVGIQREKVDFALKQDGKAVILVEVKYAGATLDNQHAAQLRRYFSTKLDVRFGILTNGLSFRFFSDLEMDNVMDDEPFLTLDLQNLDETFVDVLEQFTRTGFEKNKAIQAARSARDRQRVRRALKAEFEPLSHRTINFLLELIQPEKIDESRRTELTQLVNQEWKEFIRLQGIRTDSQTHEEPQETPISSNPDDSTWLEKTSFLAKYSLDGSVEVPVFATFQEHSFEARLSLFGMLHSAAAIIRFDDEWLTPLQAGKRSRMTIDPDATYYVNGMTYWELSDPASGELRPINDLRFDEEFLRRVLKSAKS